MEVKDLQEQVVANAFRYGEKFKVTIDQDFALLKLYEEVGEFAQAVLIHRKKSRPEKYLPEEQSKSNLADELADVIGMAIVSAHLFGIDLEDAMSKKWIHRELRDQKH
ncbi:MAG: MazG nucleotide pyrophosphohydrolase domain-containing protein [Patescibacteria group bacterium]|jgi:NTP pyrophosphatase (non-canonical NTP hydrolase)